MKTFHLILAAGMLITGSLNTISTKAADQQTTINRYDEKVAFNHPFFQALCMFIGEFLCLIVFYASKLRSQATGTKIESAKPFNFMIFLLPALCDMTGTSLMYVGLSLTDASIFQMLRGSVVIFTGIGSVLFLKNKDGSRRKLGLHQWIGMAFVLVGAGTVGSASYVCPAGGASASSDACKALLGNVLIIIAQVIVAVQMVVEETFISGYDVPALQVVGLEGMFGILSLSVVLTVMYFVPAPTAFCLYPGGPYTPGGEAYPAHCDRFEDAWDAVVQMGNNWIVSVMLVLNTFSIAFFNFFGVSVTKHMSASTRMVLDSLRTMVIWFFSLGVGWESFCWIQTIGFVVLLTGTIVYNKIIKIPFLAYPEEEEDETSEEKLLNDDDEELLLSGGAGNVN